MKGTVLKVVGVLVGVMSPAACRSVSQHHDECTLIQDDFPLKRTGSIARKRAMAKSMVTKRFVSRHKSVLETHRNCISEPDIDFGKHSQEYTQGEQVEFIIQSRRIIRRNSSEDTEECVTLEGKRTYAVLDEKTKSTNYKKVINGQQGVIQEVMKTKDVVGVVEVKYAVRIQCGQESIVVMDVLGKDLCSFCPQDNKLKQENQSNWNHMRVGEKARIQDNLANKFRIVLSETSRPQLHQDKKFDDLLFVFRRVENLQQELAKELDRETKIASGIICAKVDDFNGEKRNGFTTKYTTHRCYISPEIGWMQGNLQKFRATLIDHHGCDPCSELWPSKNLFRSSPKGHDERTSTWLAGVYKAVRDFEDILDTCGLYRQGGNRERREHLQNPSSSCAYMPSQYDRFDADNYQTMTNPVDDIKLTPVLSQEPTNISDVLSLCPMYLC